MKLITAVFKGEVLDRERLEEMIKSFNGKKIVIDIKRHTERRTVDQNAGLWLWNNFLGKETGHTPNEMHYYMCGEIYGWTQMFNRWIPKKTTSGLNKLEWQEYLTNYEVTAMDIFGVKLPEFTNGK